MFMRRFHAKGGYGEHGRSCFLVEYGTQGHYYMVDCGILDSDPDPYPNVSEEELKNTDYIFLTHCHKDHSGAFQEFVKRGFRGWLVTTKMTYELAKISYDKCLMLPVNEENFTNQEAEWLEEELKVYYGRTGHCPGGLWYRIEDSLGTCLFSGDYQEDAIFYACDPVKGQKAELAVIDCAHEECLENASELRNKMAEEIEKMRVSGASLIFPVPHYGRGIELLLFIMEKFPESRVLVDKGVILDLEQVLYESVWYREELYHKVFQLLKQWKNYVVDFSEESASAQPIPPYDFCFLSDTHLQKPYNEKFVRKELEKNTILVVTGRVKRGQLPEQALKSYIARRVLYPHHQSRGDLMKMVEQNHFQIVLPYHNEKKEMILCE